MCLLVSWTEFSIPISFLVFKFHFPQKNMFDLKPRKSSNCFYHFINSCLRAKDCLVHRVWFRISYWKCISTLWVIYQHYSGTKGIPHMNILRKNKWVSFPCWKGSMKRRPKRQLMISSHSFYNGVG